MISLQPHAEGIVLPIRAQAGSRKSELRGEQDGALKVAVTQVAEKGKANEAILALLSKQLGLRKSQLVLLSGQTSLQKRILVRDVSMAQLQAVLEDLARSDP